VNGGDTEQAQARAGPGARDFSKRAGGRRGEIALCVDGGTRQDVAAVVEPHRAGAAVFELEA
jgi:hypothetical protein